MSRAQQRRAARWGALHARTLRARTLRARTLHLGILCLGVLVPLSGQAAAPPPPTYESPGLQRLAAEPNDPNGTPQVHLDRLDFPDVPGAPGYKKHLLKVLRKEARRVRWGAGRDNRIEYRFEVTELSLRVEGGVLQVSCSAVGKLPGQRSARSRLTFGGDPARKTQVVHQVLEIVARGVLTRLSELERKRRGLR